MRIDNPEFISNYELMAKAYGARPNFHQVNWANTNLPEDVDQDYLIIRKLKFDEARGVYIYGRPGVGKTHALKLKFNEVFFQVVADKMNRILWKEFPYWIHASTYLESQKDFDNSEKMNSVRENVMKAKWLFIDDLGATTKTDWAIDQLYQIIDDRVQSGKQTFISSNLSPSEIGSFYNERISSRIAELCLPVYMKGVDRRLEGMKKDYVLTVKNINSQQA